jgi:hypothetical protein
MEILFAAALQEDRSRVEYGVSEKVNRDTPATLITTCATMRAIAFILRKCGVKRRVLLRSSPYLARFQPRRLRALPLVR